MNRIKNKKFNFYFKFFILFFFSFQSQFLKAQRQGYIWCFGDSSGIDFNNLNNPLPIVSSVHGRGSCVSIADSLGNLLFYANTGKEKLSPWFGHETEVWTRDHSKMQNGDSLIGVDWYKELVILPKSIYDSLYYLFTFSVTPNFGFCYSVIDYKQNNGYGAVIQKNIFIHNGTNFIDALAAIKHGNGRDWWILEHDGQNASNTNNFYIFYITPNYVTFIGQQSIGSNHNTGSGIIKFSPNGSKVLVVNYYGLIELFNFDKCTGNLDSVKTISQESFANPKQYVGCSFSPNGSVIYVSNTDNIFGDSLRLYQYDLTAPNIATSRQTIYTQQVPASGGLHQLGPDGKIYIGCLYEYGFPYADSIHNIYTDNLSVINYPDSLGTACDFQPFSFYLGGYRTYYGLPNNPNYELGAWVGSPCDTLVGISSVENQESKPELFVYYNVGWQKLFINAQHLKGKNCLLQIFDINGKEVFSANKKTQPPFFTQDVNVGNLSKGMFLVSLITEKEKLTKKFVKE